MLFPTLRLTRELRRNGYEITESPLNPRVRCVRRGGKLYATYGRDSYFQFSGPRFMLVEPDEKVVEIATKYTLVRNHTPFYSGGNNPPWMQNPRVDNCHILIIPTPIEQDFVREERQRHNAEVR